MMPLLDRCAAALGRPVARAAALAVVAGALALVVGTFLPARATVLAALASAWLYFAGAAAGSVALGAAIRIAQGRWAKALLPVADAGAAFFFPAWVLLLVLTLLARTWMPAGEDGGHWMVAAARDLLGGVALYACGRALVRKATGPEPATRLAVVYVLLFAVVLSMWAIDLVMSLAEQWAPSTAIPAYYFMGSFVTGLAWTTLISVLRKGSALDSDGRHDAGMLLFGMTTFLAYLLWSIFLPTWYANLPDEAGQLMLRWEGGYRPLSWAVLGLGFLFPFVLLLTEAAKRKRATLVLGASSILVGLLVERFMLVFPALHVDGSALSVALAALVVCGVGGAFCLAVGAKVSAAEG